jgi:hypothetical protein
MVKVCIHGLTAVFMKAIFSKTISMEMENLAGKMIDSIKDWYIYANLVV